jgi:hypothetical protein
MGRGTGVASPTERLEQLVQSGLQIAKKARKYKAKLTSNNYYANKLADLRAEAVNAFTDLSKQSAGDVSAMAEMIQAAFSPSTEHSNRIQIARELVFSLRTTWRDEQQPASPQVKDAIFPPAILAKVKRAYIPAIVRQMNGCLNAAFYDACAVMMRRLLELAIIEVFEHKGLSAKVKNKDGNYFYLSDLIRVLLAEQSLTLSRNAKEALPKLKKLGDQSAHGRFFTAQLNDIERVRDDFRVIFEELLHHAALLSP